MDAERNNTSWIIALLLLVLACTSTAAPISISFLDDDVVVRDTMARLEKKGCNKESLTAFQKAVRQYGTNPRPTRFPSQSGGFYTFTSSEEALAALPHELCDTVHAYEFNCFDTVILLTKGLLDSRLDADEICATLCVPKASTNDTFQFVAAVTPAEAFVVQYPDWYRAVTKPWFSEGQRNRRITLSSALFSSNFLPASTVEQTLGSNVLRVLTAFWNRQQLVFPKSMEIVLCHDVRLPAFQFVTTHAGLLLEEKKGFTYVEKAGGTGPFIRLAFAERSDLILWLAAPSGPDNGLTHRFVTFNNARIERASTRIRHAPPVR